MRKPIPSPPSSHKTRRSSGFVAATILGISHIHGFSNAWAQEFNVAQAINVAKKTGRPIFAVAGANYCPACKKLLNTLNTDESLRPLINQFVPLKINAQSQDYARWKQFFPPEKSAIPALFIVSPQGKQLFGRVGALPSKNLQKVMLSSLQKAGRYPSDQQWKEIDKKLDAVEQAIQADKMEEALEMLGPLIESLTEIESLLELSKTGKRAVDIAERYSNQQRNALKKAIHQFSSEMNLESALSVAKAEHLCAPLRQLRSEARAEVKKGISGSVARKLMRQASELFQAELLATNDQSMHKAERALQRIVKRYPNSEAAALAEQKLESLGAVSSETVAAGKKGD